MVKKCHLNYSKTTSYACYACVCCASRCLIFPKVTTICYLLILRYKSTYYLVFVKLNHCKVNIYFIILSYLERHTARKLMIEATKSHGIKGCCIDFMIYLNVWVNHIIIIARIPSHIFLLLSPCCKSVC